MIHAPLLLGNMNIAPPISEGRSGAVKALHAAHLPRPMLAKTYTAGHPSCDYPANSLLQPKLNGIRMLYANGLCWSRDLEMWSPLCLSHIRESLAPLKDVCLDGELYLHGLPLQTINSRVAVNRTSPHPKESTIEYHVFDYISNETCARRLTQLSRFLPTNSYVKLVPSFWSRSRADADRLYAKFLADKYEGGMYRDPTRPYAIVGHHPRKDNRVSWLLKRKEWLDLDATIVGMESGEGKHADTLSSFVVSWRGKVWKISSGLTDMERAELYSFGRRLIGCVCKIEYRELTGSGTPFHGRITYVELPKQ